jgi:hypothetical protein
MTGKKLRLYSYKKKQDIIRKCCGKAGVLSPLALLSIFPFLLCLAGSIGWLKSGVNQLPILLFSYGCGQKNTFYQGN